MKYIINLEKIYNTLLGDLEENIETYIEVKRSIDKLYFFGLIEDDDFDNAMCELHRILVKIKEGL